MKRLTLLAISLLLVACSDDRAAPTGVATNQTRGHSERVDFWLTVLHHNDGESDLIDAGTGLEDFGGVARFATLARRLREEAAGRTSGSILVSAGDNFLPGPELNASLSGETFYDALALDAIGYDAFIIGNHEFDLGPDFFARFVESFRERRSPSSFGSREDGEDAVAGGEEADQNRLGLGPFRLPFEQAPFLSANLDFSGESRLQTLVGRRRLAESAIVFERGRKIGIVGATTPDLRFISSPRNVGVSPDVAGAVQREIDRLRGAGAGIIIVVTHLQNVDNDVALVARLDGVDVAVAGGGDELLSNPGDLLLPGADPSGRPYPIIAQDVHGNDVPVVTSEGGYRYIGRLKLGFDGRGDLVVIDPSSGPVRVAGGANPDAVPPDPEIQATVVDPVAASVAALAANIIGTSEVDLEGRRPQIRVQETNEGNLVADALRWEATRLAAEFGVPVPDVALQNGGGIRNASLIPAGPISELLTFDMLPFTNFLTVAPDVPRDQFKRIMENAVSQVEAVSGRWAQVSGFTFSYDPTGTAQVLDPNDNSLITPGDRIVDITLDNGTRIVENGAVVPGPGLSVATIDFLAQGGDQYPFGSVPFTVLGVTYQQALLRYIVDGLGGVISAADYPEGGEGRIITAVSSLVAEP